MTRTRRGNEEWRMRRRVMSRGGEKGQVVGSGDLRTGDIDDEDVRDGDDARG